MEQRDIGELFLINFLQSIAIVSKRAVENQQIEPQKINNQIEKKAESKITIEMIPESIKQVPQLNNMQQKGKIVEINSVQKNRFNLPPQRALKPRVNETQNHYLLPQNTDINQRPTAEKLNFLIKDPAVTEIECIGSEQTLLVKKAGVVQKTHVKLSIEEIYQLIAEFSQKTKIPVIDGTIKAALNNLILTAVLSEILGPRFILQKKNPFQQLIQN